MSAAARASAPRARPAGARAHPQSSPPQQQQHQQHSELQQSRRCSIRTGALAAGACGIGEGRTVRRLREAGGLARLQLWSTVRRRGGAAVHPGIQLRRGRIQVCGASTEAGGQMSQEASNAKPDGALSRANVWLSENVVINSALMLGFFGKLSYDYFTTESTLWRGWTVMERIHRVPTDVWQFYLDSSASHPLLVPAVITMVTYLLADWISQTYEGRFALDFDRKRVARCAAVGFFILGPFAHYYYTLQDVVFDQVASIPGTANIMVPLKILCDQTLYASTYNVLFYCSLGLLRGDSPSVVASDIKRQFWRLLQAGWKLWPFVHCLTYTIIPTEHKVLWVDCIEIIWAFVLCVIVNEKRDDTVEAVMALEGSPSREGVISSVSSYISEVKEEQWAEELLPVDLQSPQPDNEFITQDTLLRAIAVEESARAAVGEFIQQEITDPRPVLVEKVVVTCVEDACEADVVLVPASTEDIEEAIGQVSEDDLNTKLQIAAKLEAVLAEVNDKSDQTSDVNSVEPSEVEVDS